MTVGVAYCPLGGGRGGQADAWGAVLTKQGEFPSKSVQLGQGLGPLADGKDGFTPTKGL